MSMTIRVLGCTGGIGGRYRTVCLAIDRDILVDTGSGAGDLAVDELVSIDHVFLTHSHLDHVAFLPLLADARAGRRNEPLTVHALPETIGVLRQHMFNGLLWPDYSVLPNPDQPYLRFSEIRMGQTVELERRRITPVPAQHSVPGVGYRLQGLSGSFVYSGDTGYCQAFWDALNDMGDLRYLVVECTFTDDQADLAIRSGHMVPALLARGVRNLKRGVDVYVAHMEPGRQRETMTQIRATLGDLSPRQLEEGQSFQL